MLDHLSPYDPEVLPATTSVEQEGAWSANELFEAKNNTLETLRALGAVDDEDIINGPKEEKEKARKTFAKLTAGQDEKQRRKAVLELRTPMSVAYASTMLAAYDWEFVNQAQAIRTYVVTKLIDESDNPRSPPASRIKALELLGKVTEVGLFTERVQMSIIHQPQEELDKRLKAKLEMLERLDVVDVESKPVADNS